MGDGIGSNISGKKENDNKSMNIVDLNRVKFTLVETEMFGEGQGDHNNSNRLQVELKYLN